MAFILFMDTRGWAKLRRLIRRKLGLNEFTVFTFNETVEETSQEMVCSICLNNLKSSIFLKSRCGHQYHLDCMKKWMEQKSECPICRKILPKIDDI